MDIVAETDCKRANEGQRPTSVQVKTTVQLDAPKGECSVIERLILKIRKEFNQLPSDNVTQLCSVCEEPQVTLQLCSACKPKADEEQLDVTQLCSDCKPRADAERWWSSRWS